MSFLGRLFGGSASGWADGTVDGGEAEEKSGLAPGEYVFECADCDGSGSVQVIQLDGELAPGDCPDCNGEGRLYVDEEEAEELIDSGATPLSGPG